VEAGRRSVSDCVNLWAQLKDDAFVVKDQERKVKKFAIDPARE
jgi:hypothetical protein